MKILLGLLAVLMVAGFFTLVPVALQRSEVSDCEKWARYANEYEDFFLTRSEFETCKAHGILINASIK